jgi:hypothetical protein
MSKIVRFALAIASGILLYVQFYLLFSGNFDDFLYTGYEWLAVPIIFFTIPATSFAFLWSALGQNEKLAKMAILLPFASPIIVGPSFGFWIGEHEKECYKKYGVKTWGVVDRAWSKRMYYYFNANGIQYMSANVTNRLGHSIGDTIEIIYNPQYPEMNSAIENL